MLPEVPVIVTEANPVTAALLAEKVMVLVVAVCGELKVAATPWGKPEADSFTLPLKPFTSLMVIVALAVEPWLTKTLLGGVTGNPGRATVTYAVCVRLPLVPITATRKFPPGVAFVVEMLRTKLPPVATALELSVAVNPAGSPNATALRPTVPLKPLAELTVMVLLPVLPWVRFSVVVEAVSPKLAPVNAGPRALSRF